MTFAADLSKFSRAMNIRLDRVVRKVIIDMTVDITKLTPVDTGLARSNWFWGYSRVTTKDQTLSVNGAPSISRAVDFSGSVRSGGSYFLVNNLPYIMRLEYGSSQQAPSGMARITVDRWQKIVDSAVGSVR